MPLRTYRGADVATLLSLAQAELGPDAMVLRVAHERAAGGARTVIMEAGDPASVAAARALETATRGAPPVALSGAKEAELEAETERSSPPRGFGSFASLRTTGEGAAAGSATPATAPLTTPATTSAAPLVLALVGPTGAGKTTTVAKLASRAGVFGDRTVGLLCLDTYRVGAREQLEAYAALDRRRIAAAHEPRDLPGARKSLAKCDVILVDCPGRGPRQHADDAAVRQLLRMLRPAEVHLVIPSGLQRAMVERHVDGFRGHGTTHLLATKVDECPDDWNVFDVAAAGRLPMRWIADGQRVPEDLRSADARLASARARFARGERAERRVVA